MLFAQLNADQICYAVSDLAGYVSAPELIPVASMTACLGKRWENGTWTEVEKTAAPAAAAPTMEELAANQLIIMQALADLYEKEVQVNG